MDPIDLLGLAAIGAIAGMMGALLGLGGGILATPLLTLFFGIPIEKAIGTSLVAIIGTSSVSASFYVEKKLSDIRLSVLLEVGTTVGAIAGAVIAGLLSRRWLTILFSTFLFYAGSSMLRRAWQRGEPESDSTPYRVSRRGLGTALSSLAGVTSGLLGVGGGPIMVPVMFLLMGVPLKVATATSNLMVGVTAAASAFIHYFYGNILVFPTAPVVIGVMGGSLAGSRLSRHVSVRSTILLFVLVMFYLAISMAWKAYRMGPS